MRHLHISAGASFETFILWHHREQWIFIRACVASDKAEKAATQVWQNWDQVNSRRQSWSGTDSLDLFSWRVGKLKRVNAALPITPPLSPLKAHKERLIPSWPTFPKTHAVKVGILDRLLVLPLSGLRLRILLVSSICVFPKETAPCAAKTGTEGLASP